MAERLSPLFYCLYVTAEHPHLTIVMEQSAEHPVTVLISVSNVSYVSRCHSLIRASKYSNRGRITSLLQARGD
jgi:hypothetical protein